MKLKTSFKKLQSFLSKNRKKVLILSILILLIGIPVVLLMKAREASSWYDDDWELRVPITVSYTGSTLTDYDVLVEIDTQSLVSASKLQSDCDDLRFVDSNDSTVLNYWIESGCNTTTTQIWVRIPNIPNGGKTIYMYY